MCEQIESVPRVTTTHHFLSIPAAFGCTGNAFSYSSLSSAPNSNSNRCKNSEADANNPNLYCSIDDDGKKDNRKLENMYDEIQKRVSASSLHGGRGGASIGTNGRRTAKKGEGNFVSNIKV